MASTTDRRSVDEVARRMVPITRRILDRIERDRAAPAVGEKRAS